MTKEYESVSVLILYWQGCDPDFEDEARLLGDLFANEFHFHVQYCMIPYENGDLEVDVSTSDFLENDAKSDSLAIIYYKGHVEVDDGPGETALWAAKERGGPFIPWSLIQRKIGFARADIFFLLDCPFDTQAMIKDDLPQNVEILAARMMGSSDAPPRTTSFTATLVDELVNMIKSAGSARVFDIYQRLTLNDSLKDNPIFIAGRSADEQGNICLVPSNQLPNSEQISRKKTQVEVNASSLRSLFRSSRCQNFEHRYFIPEGVVDQVLTTDAVRSVVRVCGVELHKQLEIIQKIEEGGRKTFAILITINRPELFTNFVEFGEHSIDVDLKLPYEKGFLKSILSIGAADDFYERQWEFNVPILRRGIGHRELNSHTILPFLETSQIAEGSFSDLQLVTIHTSHSTLAEAHSNTAQPRSIDGIKSIKKQFELVESKFVLKQLKGKLSGRNNDREIRALSILQSCKHPNILEFLGSYNLANTTNLLFPLLESDLGSLLAHDEPPRHFQAEEDFLFGLCGLASAIETLHCHILDAFGNKLIGIHKNIRPKTILVDGNKFVLAGFSCSEITQHGEGMSPLPGTLGDCIAPESIDPKDLGNGQIGQPGDVWSFGCVIAEILSFMLAGRASGVNEFRKRRLHMFFHCFYVSFFFSRNGPNPGVSDWLAKLQAKASYTGVELIRLVTDMLQLEPQCRPNARSVTRRLCTLALSSRAKRIDETYNLVAKEFGDEGMITEMKKFRLLIGSAGLLDQEPLGLPPYEGDSTFRRWADLLLRIREQLKMLDKESGRLNVMVVSLRKHNSELLKLQPPSTRIGFETKFNDDLSSKVYNDRPAQDLESSFRTESSSISFLDSGISQVEDYSTQDSSLDPEEIMDNFGSHDSSNLDDGLISVVSDKDDIGSQISTGKTLPEKAAEDHLAILLAQNKSLIPLYEQAFFKMGRARFVENFRRLLKRWYLDLLPCADNNIEKATVFMLKSRRNRTKIARRIVDIYAPESTEGGLQTEQLNEEIQGKIMFLEDWIASNVGLSSQKSEAGSEEPVGVAMTQEPEFNLSSDEEDSVEEDDSGYKDTKYVKEMEKFLTEGKAFRALLMNLQTFLLPVSLHPIVRIILSIPGNDLWVSSEQDLSIANRLKIFIEQITEEDWNWWPFRSKMRVLQDDETRLYWKCHCDMKLWAEMPKTHAEQVQNLLKYRGTDIQQDHLCGVRKRRNCWNWAAFGFSIKKAANVATNQIRGDGSSSAESPSQTRKPKSEGQNGQSQANKMSQTQQLAKAPQQVSGISIKMPHTSQSRVLFGVKGPRRTLELAQIDVLKHNNDNAFFNQLKREYKKHRGFLRYWLSFRRFNHCIFVQFLKYRENRIVTLGKSLPTDMIYEYSPRPPAAQLPHIEPHLFEIALSSCGDKCLFSFFHDCIEPADGRYFLNHTPKRKVALELKKDGVEQAWGLQAQHKISLVFVFCYHVLIFAGTWGFWAWWQSKHPSDLQGAAVPFTAVAVFISLFWSSAGILKMFREPV